MIKIIILSSVLYTSNIFATTVKNESQLSLIQTGGNAVTETYNAKTQTIIDTETSLLYTMSGHYILSRYKTNDDDGDTVHVDSVKNWSFAIKPEKELDKKLSIFSQIQFEGNKFAGFSQRDNYDVGAKYKLINTDKKKLAFEFGYRYSIERKSTTISDVDSIQEDNKARSYMEYEVIPNEALSYKFWIEYLPNFTHQEDYMIKFEPSVSMILTSNFSLKFAYNGIYDNSPAIENSDYLDFTYTTSVIAKY